MQHRVQHPESGAHFDLNNKNDVPRLCSAKEKMKVIAAPATRRPQSVNTSKDGVSDDGSTNTQWHTEPESTRVDGSYIDN